MRGGADGARLLAPWQVTRLELHPRAAGVARAHSAPLRRPGCAAAGRAALRRSRWGRRALGSGVWGAVLGGAQAASCRQQTLVGSVISGTIVCSFGDGRRWLIVTALALPALSSVSRQASSLRWWSTSGCLRCCPAAARWAHWTRSGAATAWWPSRAKRSAPRPLLCGPGPLVVLAGNLLSRAGGE